MKEKTKIYKALFIFITLLFMYLVINKLIPEYVFLWSNIIEYQKLKNQLSYENQWQEKIVSLKRQIKHLKRKINELNLEIPGIDEISKPLQVIDSMAQKNKIRLDKLQSISTDTTKQYKYMVINISCNGSFLNIMNFINDLENNNIIINIIGMKLKLNSLFNKTINSELKLRLTLKRNKQVKM